MGNHESIIDPEIVSLTQLVGSYIQKRSSLNYQINQLKLALNTKKTCIETKKLRDLKAKNASLVIEIKNSAKLLEKIKQKKYIKYKDKDLSNYVSQFLGILNRKRDDFVCISEDLNEKTDHFQKQQDYYNDRQAYIVHLREKSARLANKIDRCSGNITKLKRITERVDDLKNQLKEVNEKKDEVKEKHSKLVARRRLKRRQTLIVHKLPTNAVMLRSKLLLKSELNKQISELVADQTSHIEHQAKVKQTLELDQASKGELETLEKLNSNKKLLQSKIFKYRSELELFNSSIAPSPILQLKDIEDSLHTDLDISSDSLVN